MNIWSFNLRHLHAAAEVALQGSINAAARSVNLTQPAITQALAKLERQIGYPLFERRADGMTPTPHMLMLAPRIEAALAYIASPQVTTTQMRALLAVASAGSYVGASQLIGLSEPSLHRAIKDLALALRVGLVERRGRGIMLTPVGLRVVRSFRLARAELQAGCDELDQFAGHEVGRIVIGAMPLSRARLVPAALLSFHMMHPDTVVEVIEGAYADLIEPLRDGEIDMIVGAMRAVLPGDDIVQHPLFVDRPVIVGRRGHPLAATNPGLDEMRKFNWCLAPEGTPLRTHWTQMFADQEGPKPMVPVESGSVMVLRQLLLGSDFLTVLSPDQVAMELRAGLLVKISDVTDTFSRTIAVSTRIDWRPTPMQRKLFDALITTAHLSKTYSEQSNPIGGRA